MTKRDLRFYITVAFCLLLFAVLFLSSRRIDLKADIARSSAVSASIEDTVLLSPPEISSKLFTADDGPDSVYLKLSGLLQKTDCYKRFNQNAVSYSHDEEAHCVTLRYSNDAGQTLLFTVYSDGVCQVNSSFVLLHSAEGGAAELYQILRDLVA